MKNNVHVSVIFLMALLSAAALQAQEIPPERARLIALVDQVTRDPAKHQAAILAGQERIASGICAQCHGADGNAVKPLTPNLAGQNPAYMLEQWEKFADGRRKNFVMESLARSFTMEEKVNIAVYFASLKPKPVAADPVLAREGERIFHSVCKMCHGEDGRGEQGYARVAGQQPDYVVATIKRFRANATQAISAEDMKRHNARMEQVTQNLSDREIEGLAAFIALLK